MADIDPQLYPQPSWEGLVLIAPGALIVAILTSIFHAHRATQVQVTEVLRYEKGWQIKNTQTYRSDGDVQHGADVAR